MRIGSQILVAITLLLCTCALAGGQAEYSLVACASSAKAKKMLGGRFKLHVSKESILKRGHDVDYSDYAIGFGAKKNRVWLEGIFGPHATSGKVPDAWLSASSEVSQKKWKFADLEGVDVKGKLPNGNYWRYLGMMGESIKYYDVAFDAAAYFDGVINGICVLDWRRTPPNNPSEADESRDFLTQATFFAT